MERSLFSTETQNLQKKQVKILELKYTIASTKCMGWDEKQHRDDKGSINLMEILSNLKRRKKLNKKVN